MSKTPENSASTQRVDTNEGAKKASEGVSVERQLELAKKYGVSDELVAKLLNEQTSTEEQTEIVSNIVKTLANAILHTLVDPDDVEDVSAMVGPRWGVSKKDYLPFYYDKQARAAQS